MTTIVNGLLNLEDEEAYGAGIQCLEIGDSGTPITPNMLWASFDERHSTDGIDRETFDRCFEIEKIETVRDMGDFEHSFGEYRKCESHGEVKDLDPDTVWSIVDCDGVLWVTPGFRVVNHMDYLVAKNGRIPGRHDPDVDYYYG